MGVEITFSGNYFWLDSWVLANILQFGTQSFCDRFITYQIDPCHRLYDQMTLAARSVPANIAEGASRHDTSRETEMRLTDVGRGSLRELQGDYFNYILRYGQFWSNKSEAYRMLMGTDLDKPAYTDDFLHDVGEHIRSQKQKFDIFLENPDPVYCANALMYLCQRITFIVRGQLNYQLEQFKVQGGFKENMTQERLKAKTVQDQAQGAPLCPKCGAPMVRCTASTGTFQGKQFWGCSNYRRTGCTGRFNIKS